MSAWQEGAKRLLDGHLFAAAKQRLGQRAVSAISTTTQAGNQWVAFAAAIKAITAERWLFWSAWNIAAPLRANAMCTAIAGAPGRNGTAHPPSFSHLLNKALPARQAWLGCAAPQSASPVTPCVEGLMRHRTAGRLIQNKLVSPKHGSCFWIDSAAIHSSRVSGAHHASCRCPTATADEHIRHFFALSFSLGERTALPVNFRCALLGGRKPQFRSRHMSRMFLVAQPHSAAFLHICRT